MIPPVHIWKEPGGVDNLYDFQLNELRQNRDMDESIY